MELASTPLIAVTLFCLFDGTLQPILPMKRSVRSKSVLEKHSKEFYA
jgi:hypothetical protein